MRHLTRVLSVLALCALATSLVGCDLLGLGNENRSLPDGPVLAASMTGNTEGLWLFDPSTLEREAIVEAVEGQTIQGMARSSNSGRWYLSWSVGSTLEGTHREVLAAVDPSTGQIVERASFSDRSVAGPLVYEPTRGEIVAYGSGSYGARFFDAETLKRVRRHPIGPTDSTEVPPAVVAADQGKIYFGSSRFRKTRKVRVYDVSEQAVVRSFRPTADPALRESGVTDLALSPDGRFLYATTYSLQTGGAFSAVELEAGEVIAEHPAGSYANLAVHPNGQYVYVDCPAGGRRNLIPTQQVLRFDVTNRKIEVFIDGAEGEGVKGLGSDAALVATHITAQRSNRGIVMTVSGPTQDGEDVHMVRVDAETGTVLSTYSLPRDDRGYLKAAILDIQFASGPEREQ
jgi:DNA-binding beta-propeller fold protein YncE